VSWLDIEHGHRPVTTAGRAVRLGRRLVQEDQRSNRLNLYDPRPYSTWRWTHIFGSRVGLLSGTRDRSQNNDDHHGPAGAAAHHPVGP